MKNNIDLRGNPCSDSVSLYVFERGDKKIRVYTTNKVVKEYNDGDEITPSLVIPKHFLPELLKAIVDLGIQSPDQSFISGELVATKFHLEDTRKLLKLK